MLDIEIVECEKIIVKCIDQLDGICKKVLMYYYFEEMLMQDIVDKFGFVNIDMVKIKKYKCKKKFDDLVKVQYFEKDFLDQEIMVLEKDLELLD